MQPRMPLDRPRVSSLELWARTAPPRKSSWKLVLLSFGGLAFVVIAGFAAVLLGASGVSMYDRDVLPGERDLNTSQENLLVKLEEEIRISRDMYPQIIEIEQLLGARVTGSNGWQELEAGGADALQTSDRAAPLRALAHKPVPEGQYADAMAATDALPASIQNALLRECIVPMVQIDANGHPSTTTAGLHELLDGCLGRVIAQSQQGLAVETGRELLPLVELCSRASDDRTRAAAEWWSSFRVRTLKYGVIPAIERGHLSRAELRRIMELRWKSTGNDLDMWVNNLAEVVARYQWSLDNDSNALLPKQDRPSEFRNLSQFAISAYVFHIRTARKHVDEAVAESFDLRNSDHLQSYLDKYSGNDRLDLAEG